MRHDPRLAFRQAGASRVVCAGVRPPRKEKSTISTTTTKATQGETLAQLQALISGLQKQLPSGSFTLVSTAYTTATLVQALQGTIAVLDAVVAAHAALKVALASWDAEDAKMGPIVLALTRTLQSMYADAPDTLALFALKPRKAPAPRTSAQKAASAAKAAATRVARGTASKKKKAAITGNVTGITITPITAPTAAPPAAQPVNAQPVSPPVAAPPAAAQPATPAPAVAPPGHVGQ